VHNRSSGQSSSRFAESAPRTDVLGIFSRPLRDWSVSTFLPSTPCWATLSRPSRDWLVSTKIYAQSHNPFLQTLSRAANSKETRRQYGRIAAGYSGPA